MVLSVGRPLLRRLVVSPVGATVVGGRTAGAAKPASAESGMAGAAAGEEQPRASCTSPGAPSHVPVRAFPLPARGCPNRSCIASDREGARETETPSSGSPPHRFSPPPPFTVHACSPLASRAALTTLMPPPNPPSSP